MSFQELHSAIAAFRETFGCEPVACGYAPGRVNLIGDHTDYNDGFVFPMAIPVGTIVLGCHTDSTTTTILTLSDVGDKQIAFENKEIKADAENRTWVNYVKGVIALFPHQPVRPFNAVISSNVPLGAGLSSSAALEVAFFHFLEALSGNNITDLSIAEKATICQQAEHDFAGVPCGIMDQVVSFGGKEGQALLIDCRSTTIEYIPITNNDVVFVVTDSHVKHEHAGGEYKNRRRACEQVASLLGKTSLRDISMRELESSQSVLSEELYRIGRHVITENERTIDAAEALKRNDIRTFGTLMTQSHVSLRDDYQVSCPEIDELVEIALVCEGVLGSRMTGGGFGGSTVTLVSKDKAQDLIQKIQEKYTGGKVTANIFSPSDGGRKINLANN